MTDTPFAFAEAMEGFVADYPKYLASLRGIQENFESSVKILQKELKPLVLTYEGGPLNKHMQAVDAANVFLEYATLSLGVTLGVRYSTQDGYAFSHKQPSILPGTLNGSIVNNANKLWAEFELLANARDHLCIMDGSFWSMLMQVNIICTKAKKDLSKAELDAIEGFLVACVCKENPLFLQLAQNQQIVGISKHEISSSLYTKYKRLIPDMPCLPDKAIWSEVLEPGQYTKPKPLQHAETDGHIGVHSDFHNSAKEKLNQLLTGKALTRIDQIRVVYFRPWPWTHAYRIEYHSERFGSDISELLGTLMSHTQMSSIIEPMPQNLVDLATKQVCLAANLYGEQTKHRYPNLLRNFRTS